MKKIAWSKVVFLCLMTIACRAVAVSHVEREPNHYNLTTFSWDYDNVGAVSGSDTISGTVSKSDTDVFRFTPRSDGERAVVSVKGIVTCEFYDCTYFGTAGCAFGYVLSTDRCIYRMFYDGDPCEFRALAGITYYIRVTSFSATPTPYTITFNLPDTPQKKPDLAPYAPTRELGWDSALVIAKSDSAKTSCLTYKDAEDIYVNWCVLNTEAPCSPLFTCSLYIDNELVESWQSQQSFVVGDGPVVTAFRIGRLSAGSHAIKLVADSGNDVLESNENNNSITRTIAVESSVPTYTVTYRPGAYGAGDVASDEVRPSSGAKLRGAMFARTGYSQTGWSRNPSGDSRDYGLGETYANNASVTLYPYWTANTYSVAYSLGDGGAHGSTHPTSATYDTTFSVSAPKKDGFVFKGWTLTSGLNASTAKWGASSSPSTAIGSSSTVCANGAEGTVWFKNLTAQAGGSVTLMAKWETVPRPTNDDFRNASWLSGSSGQVTQSNADATAESGEPLVRRWSAATTTVWWKWTAPSDGRVQFNTDGSSFDTVLGVYTGSSLSSLTKVTEESDDGPGLGRASMCEFSCASKTYYYIAVGGYSGASGEIRLQWAVTSTVDITFDGNGATSGAMSRVVYERGKVYALPKCAFRKSGKRFAGWICSKTGRRYDDGVLVFNLAEPGETVTMTAIWE